jgi:hypothetical protein
MEFVICKIWTLRHLLYRSTSTGISNFNRSMCHDYCQCRVTSIFSFRLQGENKTNIKITKLIKLTGNKDKNCVILTIVILHCTAGIFLFSRKRPIINNEHNFISHNIFDFPLNATFQSPAAGGERFSPSITQIWYPVLFVLDQTQPRLLYDLYSEKLQPPSFPWSRTTSSNFVLRVIKFLTQITFSGLN